MQTSFSPAQLADPVLAEDEGIIRKCVHCGFCNATCPTYVLLGDELDSPRGRIYLIKEMLENEQPATAEVVRHLDRCLSCLACVTTCPSGVDYQHLIDHARAHVERTYRRPMIDRWLRAMLAWVLPYPRRLSLLLQLARPLKPFRRLLPARLEAMLSLLPPAQPVRTQAATPPAERAQAAAADREKPARRIALLDGCVQLVMGGHINDATRRLLERAGCEVVPLDGCCGAIVQHLGREQAAESMARQLIDRIESLQSEGRIDAVVVNASGCGTQLKDLGHLLKDDATYAARAAMVSALVRDVTEYVAEIGLPETRNAIRLQVAYHSACSMQHGQQLHRPPRELLTQAGFDVLEIPDGHLCCGSAGTYNMLQPVIAGQLRERKLAAIASTGAAVVATGNLGCIAQLAQRAGSTRAGRDRRQLPVVHTVELLDWATGGPAPAGFT
jgi:glycolate oxidase iron-sulfur subunit